MSDPFLEGRPSEVIGLSYSTEAKLRNRGYRQSGNSRHKCIFYSFKNSLRSNEPRVSLKRVIEGNDPFANNFTQGQVSFKS